MFMLKHPPILRRLAACGGAVLLFCLGSVGCTARVGGDGRSLAQHNDELRRDNLELRQQIESTQQQLALLENELRVYRDGAATGQAIPGAAAPIFSGIELGRYSGPVDNDGDGVDDELRLYVKPTDQRGRTLITPGRAVVRLIQTDSEPPKVWAEQTWAPAQWDGTYRSGFTGDHYSLALPLPAGYAAASDTLTVMIEITEATRGIVQKKQVAYTLQW